MLFIETFLANCTFFKFFLLINEIFIKNNFVCACLSNNKLNVTKSETIKCVKYAKLEEIRKGGIVHGTVYVIHR